MLVLLALTRKLELSSRFCTKPEFTPFNELTRKSISRQVTVKTWRKNAELIVGSYLYLFLYTRGRLWWQIAMTLITPQSFWLFSREYVHVIYHSFKIVSIDRSFMLFVLGFDFCVVQTWKHIYFRPFLTSGVFDQLCSCLLKLLNALM